MRGERRFSGLSGVCLCLNSVIVACGICTFMQKGNYFLFMCLFIDVYITLFSLFNFC